MNPDGSLDTTFTNGVDGGLGGLALQPDGKILVGGNFTTLAGQARRSLGRLNADGSLDTSFTSEIGGAQPWVQSLAVQADGKILVGGWFTTLAGESRSHLGRLNADGSLDTTFTNGVNDRVLCLAVQADGKILVGGLFTTLGGQPRANLGRLNADGSLDVTFTNGANNCVYSLAVQADGKILVGGEFTTLGGQPRSHMGRLNEDGSLDATFTNGSDSAVGALAVQADGKILVGGEFTTLGGQPHSHLGRLNADGSLDATFTDGANSEVDSLAMQADGKILVGGLFTTLGGQAHSCLGRLSTDTAAIQNLRATTNSVTWERSGAGPEVWRTTFEQSINGVDWIDLGAGARIMGSWQVTNLTLPTGTNFYVRARGFACGGIYNASESVIESIRLAYFAPFLASPIHYVSPIGKAVSPYTNWATAATNIQAAIDAAVDGDIVLVTNGVYNTGGRPANGSLTNRVAITKAITVRSVNGPEVTLIEGAGPQGDAAIRCVYLGANAALIGFMLTNGHTRMMLSNSDGHGGGIFCEPSTVLSNCVLSGNSAYSLGGGSFGGTLNNCTLSGNSTVGGSGGGSSGGTLYNCTLTGNSAFFGSGGGSSGGTLYNCTLTGNLAFFGSGGGSSGGTLYNCTLSGNEASGYLGDSLGGGSFGGTLNNCIVYYNSVRYSNVTLDQNFNSSTFNYSCTTPDPGGTGNITNDPQFVDATNGDYRLLPSSPCIDRGINQDWMLDATDLDGNPRILNGMVDMGAYEFPFQGNFKVWLQGPYDTNAHRMTTALNVAGNIPLTSPYADDPRRVSAIPSNATDWVLLQLRKSTNSAPFVSKSVFLGQEGHLLSDGGTTG